MCSRPWLAAERMRWRLHRFDLRLGICPAQSIPLIHPFNLQLIPLHCHPRLRCSPSSRAWSHGWPPCSSQSSPSTCSRWVGTAEPHRLAAGGALGLEPLFLLGVHRMPAAAAREWQGQRPLPAVATTVQACPPSPAHTPPHLPCPSSTTWSASGGASWRAPWRLTARWEASMLLPACVSDWLLKLGARDMPARCRCGTLCVAVAVQALPQRRAATSPCLLLGWSCTHSSDPPPLPSPRLLLPQSTMKSYKWSILLLALSATLREGIESVLFLTGVSQVGRLSPAGRCLSSC